MSEEKREDFLGEIPTEAEVANWDLNGQANQPETTDLLAPAAENSVEEAAENLGETEPVSEVVEQVAETAEELATTPSENAENPEIAENPTADTLEATVEAVEEIDLFLPRVTETPDADQVPVDVLANHELPEPEPARRSFDFSTLSGDAEPVTEAPVQDAPVAHDPAEIAVADAPVAETVTEAAAEEDTAVERKAILDTVVAPSETGGWQPREDGAVSDNTAALVLGSTSLPLVVPSRVAARVWSFFLTLLLAPAAWYLLTDAAARFALADEGPFQTGVLNLGALIEFAAGIVVAIVILAFLVRSSLGALFTGLLVMAAGTPFIVVPALTKTALQPALDWLVAWNSFGANLAHHLNWTGYTGAIFVAGLLLFVMGIMAILARRDGRKEQQIRAQIEQYAPAEKKRK